MDPQLKNGGIVPLDMVMVVEHIRGCVQRDNVKALAHATGLEPNAIYMFRRGATFYPKVDILNTLLKHYLPHAKIVIPVDDAAKVEVV